MIPRPGGLARSERPGADARAARVSGRGDDQGAVGPTRKGRGLSHPKGGSTLPALRRAELALARQERSVGSRAVRVPLDAFVPIAMPRLLPPPRETLMLAAPAEPAVSGANDNRTPAPSSTGRALLHELLFLLLLAVTLALTFYVGRLNAAQNVIVVPGPSGPQNLVT